MTSPKRIDQLGETNRYRLMHLGVIASASKDTRPCLQIWRDWVKAGLRTKDGEGVWRPVLFEEYRRIRRWLDVSNEKHPPKMLKRAAKALKSRTATIQTIESLLGRTDRDQIKEVRSLAGKSGTPGGSRIVTRRGGGSSIDLLPSEVADALRDRWEALDPRYLPKENHVARADQLEEHWREFAHTMLVRCAIEGVSTSSAGIYLKTFEDLAELCLAHDLRTPLSEIIEEYLRLSRGTANQAYRADRILKLVGQYNRCAALVEDVAVAPAFLEVFAPLKCWGENRSRLDGMMKTAEAQNRDEKAVKTVVRLAFDGEIRTAADLRFEQARRHYAAFRDACAALEESGDESLTFEVVEPSLNLDGTLGRGDQIVRYRLCKLNEAARIVREGRPAILQKEDFDRSRGWAPREEKFILLFEECVSVFGSEKRDDPYFVEMFRWGLFDTHRPLPDSVLPTCGKMCAEWDFRPMGRPMGMLLSTPREQVGISNAFRRLNASSKVVVIPMLRLWHALLIGKISAEVSEVARARASEQLQIAPDGLGIETLRGKQRAYFTAIPKWRVAKEKFYVRVETVDLIKELAKLAVERFGVPSLHGRLKLPLCNFDGGHHLVSAGYYLIRKRERGLDVAELNACLRALFAGLCHVNVHDERVILTTKDDLKRIGGKILKRRIKHSPKTDSVRHYNLGPDIRNLVPGARFLGARSLSQRP